MFSLVRHFFHHPFLQTDTFVQNCRKHIITASWAIVLLNVILLIVSLPFVTADTVLVRLVRHGDGIFVIVFLISTYVCMWQERHVSDTLAQTLFSGALVVLTFQAVREANTSSSVFITMVLVGAIISNVPHIGAFCFVGMCTLGLHYYNLSAVTSKQYPPLLLPDPFGSSTPCNDSNEVVLFLLFCSTGLSMWLVYAQTRSFQNRLSATTANTNMARQVTELLAQYKTDLAAAALKSHDGCDEDLVEVFGVIVRNMEKYRPYLPNYLLFAECDMSYDGDGAQVTEIDSNPSLASSRSSVVENIFQPTARDSLKHQQSEIIANHFLQESTCHHRAVTFAVLDYSDVFTAGMTLGTEHHSLRTSIVEFVEYVHIHASTHNGAVHSFLGDRVMMSWNAITRSADHYYRGALTLMELRECVQEECGNSVSKDVVIHGAVVSGPVRCQRGGTHTFAWTLHAPSVFHELQSIQIIASESKCILTSRTHAQQIEHCAKTQAIDAFRLKNDKVCVVHEVIEIIRPNLNDPDDEWMYQINHSTHGESVHSQVTGCLMKVIEETAKPSYTEGLNTMEELMKELVREQITQGMMHLFQRLQGCVAEISTMPRLLGRNAEM